MPGYAASLDVRSDAIKAMERRLGLVFHVQPGAGDDFCVAKGGMPATIYQLI